MATGIGPLLQLSSAQGNDIGNERIRAVNWRDRRTSTQCLSYLYLSEHLSDISFTFSAEENVKLPAHKFVLSMRSAVFEAMFYGSLSEGGETVIIEDIEHDVMKIVLQYIYSDKSKIDGNNVLQCLYTAKKYDLHGLVQQCSDYLEGNIDVTNVCLVHEQALLYEMMSLQEKCLAFILDNTTSVMSSPGFLNLSHSTLLNILRKDELSSDEIEIFQGAIRWAEHNCDTNKKPKVGQNIRDQLGEALYQIRFPIMPIDEFAHVVTLSGILTKDELLMLYQYNATKQSTSLGKFNNYERAGAPVTVDLLKNAGSQFFMGNCGGCFLQLGYDKSLTVFLYTSPQLQPRKKYNKLKSVTGNFVEKVKGVKVNRTRTTDYEIKGKKIVLLNPVDIPGHLIIEFLFNDGNHACSDLVYSDHITYNTNQMENIKGQTITITKVPEGLESITFA